MHCLHSFLADWMKLRESTVVPHLFSLSQAARCWVSSGQHLLLTGCVAEWSWTPQRKTPSPAACVYQIRHCQKTFVFWVLPIGKQWCDRFRWTVKGLSHTYTCICLPPNPAPIQATTEHGAELPAPHCRSSLVSHFKYRSMCMSIPNSRTIPSPQPFLLATSF